MGDMKQKIVGFFGLAFSLFIHFPQTAHAQDVPQSFTLDGQLFSDPAATTPLIDGMIGFTVQILDDGKTCVLYEETQSVSTLASKGYFTVQVGTEVGNPKRTTHDSNNTMSTVFQNISAITGVLVANPAQSCTIPAGAGKRRYVRIMIAPPTMGSVTRTLAPDLTIDSVPNSIIAERAETLQGLRSTDVLKVNTSAGAALSQSNLESLFSSTTRFNSLSSVVDGTSPNYMRSNSSNGAQLPVLTGAPMTPPIGAIWYDSSDSKIKFQTSVGPAVVGTSSGSVTSVGFSAPTEFSVSGSPVTSAGTIAVTWTAQTANKVLAAPDSATGTPTFRTLTAADIPNLSWNKITADLPTTLLGYGITDAVQNAGGTPSFESGLNTNKGAATTAGKIWISTDTKEIYRANGATWDQIGSASGGTAGGDLDGTYPNPKVVKIQNVSVDPTAPLAGQVLKYGASSWVPSNFSIGDLKTSGGAQQFLGSTTCTDSQTLTWSTLTDTFVCKNIASLPASVITTGTIDAARLPASAITPWTTVAGGINYSGGNVGIGAATPAAQLHNVMSSTHTSGIKYVAKNSATYSPSSDASGGGLVASESSITATGNRQIGFLYGESISAISNSTSPVNYLVGASVSTQSTGSSVTSGAIWTYGVNSTVTNSSNGTMSYGEAIRGYVVNNVVGGTIAHARGGRFGVTQTSGTISNGYGVLIDNVQATNKWSLYALDATAPSYFAGSVGIGTTSPQTSLDLSAKTDALRLPSGTTGQRPGTPASGDIRYNSTNSTLEAYVNGSWVALNTAVPAAPDAFSYRQVGINTGMNATDNESYYMFGQAATHASTQTGVVTLSTQLMAIPFITTSQTNIDRLIFNITTAGSAGAKVRIGIYTNTSGTMLYPENLLLDAGEFAGDSMGVVTVPVSTTLPANSVVWCAVWANDGGGGAKPIVRAIRPDQGQVLNILGWNASMTNQATTILQNTPYVTGTSFPATFPTGATRSNGNIPAIGMRFTH